MPTDRGAGNGASDWAQYFATLRAADNPLPHEPPPVDRLVPDPDLPVSEVVVYRTAGITRLPAGSGLPRELDGPLDPLAAPATGARTPAEGVLLTHEQAWRMRGLALGRLLHSTALAPGEVTQVAMTAWDRTTTGELSEDVSADETATQAAARDRGIHDVTSAVAHQTQVGTSSTSALASQTDSGVGGVAGFLGVSGGGSANLSVASAVAFNTGARSLAADSTQTVRETTQQQASNVRGQRATLVEEVGESETEQFTTRVVANYNHMHALTVMYFEVLQVYELSTRVTDAERLLFLPMAPMAFDDPERVAAFARPLARAARSMGLAALAERLDRLDEDAPARAARKAVLDAALSAARAARDKAAKDAEDALGHVRDAPADPASALARLRLAADAAAAALAGRNVALAEAVALVRLAEETAAHELADVAAQLQDRSLAFNQALWLQLEPDQVAAMLAGRWHEGVSLAQTVDPAPVAVVGHQVGFRWGFPAGQEGAAAAFRARHVSGGDAAEPGDDDDLERDTIVLPTGGVFAEAVLGRANCGERLDLTRFWRWDDTTIPILPTGIERLRHRRRARPGEARPVPLAAPAVAVQPLPDGPAGPSHTLASLVGTSLFRDLSTGAVIGDLLTAAQGAAAQGSAAAQQAAHDNISAYLDHVEQILPAITQAVAKRRNAQGGQGGQGRKGPVDPSTLGALQNALGKEGAGIDVEGLLGSATELGLFL